MNGKFNLIASLHIGNLFVPCILKGLGLRRIRNMKVRNWEM
jgi:hypothetical protein